MYFGIIYILLQFLRHSVNNNVIKVLLLTMNMSYQNEHNNNNNYLNMYRYVTRA